MANGSFETQDSNPDAWVGVRAGEHGPDKVVHSEFLVQEKDGQRIHLGIDEQGNEIYRTPWH